MKSTSGHAPASSEEAKTRYEPPRVVVYDESDLLDMIGPALACARWTGSAPPRGGRTYDPNDYEDF